MKCEREAYSSDYKRTGRSASVKDASHRRRPVLDRMQTFRLENLQEE